MAEDRGSGNQRQRPRRLLPAHQPREISLPQRSTHHIPPRLLPIGTACDACRKKKRKCSGQRPVCHNCLRHRYPCHYTKKLEETEATALRQKYKNLQCQAAAYEELLGYLQNLPEPDAQAVMRYIRSGVDFSTVLGNLKAGGDICAQMAVVPETRFRYQLPYRSEMPAYYMRDNPYLDSLLYEATTLYSRDAIPGYTEQMAARRVANRNSEDYRGIYLTPFHASEVIESLLSDVNVSYWTTVCDDNVLLRDLIRNCFRCEYQFTSAFQKDLFLQDMVAHRQDFCSSLLVNIFLGYSCTCYPGFANRAEYWNPSTWTYRFVVEAKRIWELESTTPRLTTIQAGIIFNVFHNLSGLDEIGQAYLKQSVNLSHQLRLFEPVEETLDERLRRGRLFTAWSLYNWETLIAFSFLSSPLLTTPPKTPLPDPSENPEWYGEVWLRYPLNYHLTPSNFGGVFKAKTSFRIIMNEACQVAYADPEGMTLKKATHLLSRLYHWYDELPELLGARSIVLPAHIQLHLYYYHLILTMYEPLLGEESDQVPSPRQIVADAKKHLHTLIRLYYLRHGYDAMDLFIIIPLMLSATDCLDTINDETPAEQLELLRSTLILATKGLYDQRRNHYLAEALFRVILGRMRPEERSLLKGNLTENDDEVWDEKQKMAQAVRSHWPVGVVKKKENIDSYILKNLVENYANLSVDEDAAVKEELRSPSEE